MEQKHINDQLKLSDFPKKIIMLIASFLDEKAILNFRLVNTYFELISRDAFLNKVAEKSIKQIASGAYNSYLVKGDGTVYTWDHHDRDPRGSGQFIDCNITQVPELKNILSISSGTYNTFAISMDGTLYAWGANAFGELGLGHNRLCTTPQVVWGLKHVVGVTAGYEHTLALTQDGTLYAWGNNDFGQLGLGRNDNSDISQVGYKHSLAVTKDGTLWACGNNDFGQFGLGRNKNCDTPEVVSTLKNVVSVAAGKYHSLAVTKDGKLYAWGNNLFGQLGLGHNVSCNSPQLVRGIKNVVGVTAGDKHSLAVTKDGTVYAWGNNHFGQLGLKHVEYCDTPQMVTVLKDVVNVTAGTHHTFAVTKDGTLYAWGNNLFGQLGLGHNIVKCMTPQVVTKLLRNTVSVAVGEEHTFAITKEDTFYAWGNNDFAQLRFGSQIQRFNNNNINQSITRRESQRKQQANDKIINGIIAKNAESAQQLSELMYYHAGKLDEEETLRAISILQPEAAKNNSYALWALAMIQLFSHDLKQNKKENIDLLDLAVELNNPFAMRDRGALLMIQDKPDYIKAANLYEKALNNKIPLAANLLGILHRGSKIEGIPNYEKAKEYFLMEIQLGSPRGYYQIGNMLEEGLIDSINKEPNIKKAQEYYELAMQQGEYGDAFEASGLLFLNGKIGAKNGIPNYEKAKELLELSIEKGYAVKDYAKTFYHLGMMYAKGWVGKTNSEKPDYEKASKYYALAIKHNKSTIAAKQLGYLLYKGYVDKINKKRNYGKVKTLMQFAIRESQSSEIVANAAYYMGVMIHKGNIETIDGSPNYGLAQKFLEVALEKGNYKAYLYLGLMYEKGHIGKINSQPNFTTAKEFYEIAIEKNVHVGSATLNLAKLYLGGHIGRINGNPDYKKASEYFETAIQLGKSEGYFYLGYMYMLGYIGKENDNPNYEKAKMYFDKAIECADKKHPSAYGAYYYIGDMYAKDLIKNNNQSNPEIALFYLESAFKKDANNKGLAAMQLGVFEYKKKNYTKAAEYFEVARSFNIPEATKYLSHYYIKGLKPYTVDIEYAIELFNKYLSSCPSTTIDKYLDTFEELFAAIETLKHQQNPDWPKLFNKWESIFKSKFKLNYSNPKDGNNILQVAISHEFLGVAVYLVRVGIDINHINNEDLSPLEMAAKKGQTGLALFLIKNRAEIRKENYPAVPKAVNLAGQNRHNETKEKILAAVSNIEKCKYWNEQEKVFNDWIYSRGQLNGNGTSRKEEKQENESENSIEKIDLNLQGNQWTFFEQFPTQFLKELQDTFNGTADQNSDLNKENLNPTM